MKKNFLGYPLRPSHSASDESLAFTTDPRSVSTFSVHSVRGSASRLPAKFGGTGRVGALTLKQQSTLDRCRTEMMSEGLFNPDRHTDYLILRFLRARKFDLEATMKMIRACEQWRRDFKVDELYRNFEFPEEKVVESLYPRYYHKTDRFGRPVYFEEAGSADITELFKVTTEDRMIKHFISGYEKLVREKFPACSAYAERNIEECLVIMDLKGLSLKEAPRALSFVRRTTAIAQDYYPEQLGRMYVINAPLLFSSIWNLIKNFLDEVTASKIVILGSKYTSSLLKDIAPENLPEKFGGSCRCENEGGCRHSDAGPWRPPPVDI
ncbi:uncharacterized protein VTP21DRAFT_4945 [Calcarisporiella thermophila]|uniref:uncharacterized protein n=1 Tax=Calcarisporiella thermophila TaxID=911321 RepID=UPI00374362B7